MTRYDPYSVGLCLISGVVFGTSDQDAGRGDNEPSEPEHEAGAHQAGTPGRDGGLEE